MRTLALALGAALLAAAAGLARPPATPASTQVSPVLAMLGERAPLRLGLVDGKTLAPLAGRRIEVGTGGCASRNGGTGCWSLPAWSFSPDRSLLAVARNTGYSAGSVRIVDVRRLRVREDVPLQGLPVGGLAWMAPGRVLALQEVCCAEMQQVVAIDLARQRVESRTALRGSIVRVARTRGQLVLLLAPARAVGPARLALVDARGAVRSVPLRGLVAGSEIVDYRRFLMEQQLPGLAVDPSGNRAFVVGPGAVAVVDLRTLATRYHPLRATAAVAKASRGAIREALWLGGGLLAVSGEQLSLAGNDQRSEAAGLVVVDTTSWNVRTIDVRATRFALWRDVLLATDASAAGASGDSGSGLAAYGFDGTPRFRVLEGKTLWGVRITGSLAYAGIVASGSSAAPQTATVALPAGTVTGVSTQQQVPVLIEAGAASWWESPF